MEGSASSPAVQAAKDQALFREVNERLRDMNEAFETLTRDSEFICECANRDCIEHVLMTLAEYEEVRANPTHFLVLPGHVVPEVEQLVSQTDGYLVVQKIGDAGAVAIRLDPRSRPAPNEAKLSSR
jgi:hypothetical protein